MRLLIALLVVVSTVGLAQEDGPLTEADGADFESALASLYRHVSESDNESTGLTTNRAIVLTQRALNGYLRFQGLSILPEGLSDVTVEIQEGGLVTAFGTVNLDEIDEFDAGPTGMLQFLSGSLPVSVSVAIEERDGALYFALGDTQIGPVNVPAALAQLLIQQYSVNESYPTGIDLANPLLIPSVVEDIQIQQGQITVVIK
tara:strand:+ start:3750 stop:4355 length:606 start_codon:yes stop_codon:yes gene_type:complete